MGKALQPPERTRYTVALESSGGLVGANWHRAFYAYFDAFLSAARSTPELIRCCFGVDDATKQMRDWFKGLDLDERQRQKRASSKVRMSFHFIGGMNSDSIPSDDLRFTI